MNYALNPFTAVSFAACILSSNAYAAETYSVDSGHTLVAFEFNQLVFSRLLVGLEM